MKRLGLTDGTCQGCRVRGRVWFTLCPFAAVFCLGCWDVERFGPTPTALA